MKGFIAGVLVALLVIFGGLYLGMARGWYPVGADNEPTKFERQMAHMAMEAYVEKHAPKQENPIQLTNENLIEGAEEYEEHCAICHGGAKSRISPLAGKFNPPVPQLINRVPLDADANLFWITKHGIRLTGMPGWGGLMDDDEMWKIVAFIKNSNKLPPEVQTAWQAMANKGEDAVAGEHKKEAPAGGTAKKKTL